MNGHDRIRSVLTGPSPALLPYLTAGLPNPASSADLFVAMADAGADAFEVGVPYSDPLMDGPVIMAAGEAALAAGTTRAAAMKIVEEVASRTGKPVLAMTYANPVMQRGWDRYVEDLVDAGGCGLIVPDLPLEESAALARSCRAAGLGLVQFVSPTSPSNRIKQVAAADPAFIYGVADMGVTGERAEASAHLVALSGAVRDATNVPLVFGVGISSPEQAAAVRGLGEGVIVGTALVRIVLDSATVSVAAERLARAVSDFKSALT